MKFWWLVAALVVTAAVLTCAIKQSTEYAALFSKQQSQADSQFQAAQNMLREFPAAAGKQK
jgi:hypothetical protein